MGVRFEPFFSFFFFFLPGVGPDVLFYTYWGGDVTAPDVHSCLFFYLFLYAPRPPPAVVVIVKQVTYSRHGAKIDGYYGGGGGANGRGPWRKLQTPSNPDGLKVYEYSSGEPTELARGGRGGYCCLYGVDSASNGLMGPPLKSLGDVGGTVADIYPITARKWVTQVIESNLY